MDSLDDRINGLTNDLHRLKKERKQVKKAFGKRSVEYAELTEEIDEIKDHIEFECLHG